MKQKLKFDRHLKAQAHAIGDAVWVFCHIIHKGGTGKLTRALQDGRLYVLDTGQKVHFERLKKHVPAPWDQNVAIIADPYVEKSHEEISSDVSRDSFLPEQLPEASFESEPTLPVPLRTIQTRTQTALELVIPRRRFSQFGYPSDSELQQEIIEPPSVESSPQMVFPELDELEPLFSDQEEIHLEEPINSLLPLPSGTSAPLLSNPSLTDTLSNFPLFNSQIGNPGGSEPLIAIEQPQESKIQDPTPNQPHASPITSNRKGRPRGRPSNRRRENTASSSKTTASFRGPIARQRKGSRTRISSRAPRLEP